MPAGQNQECPREVIAAVTTKDTVGIDIRACSRKCESVNRAQIGVDARTGDRSSLTVISHSNSAESCDRLSLRCRTMASGKSASEPAEPLIRVVSYVLDEDRN